jgi:hypothetical protein
LGRRNLFDSSFSFFSFFKDSLPALNDKRRDNLQELWAAQAASSDFA